MKKRLFYEAPEAEPLVIAVEVGFLGDSTHVNNYGNSKAAAQDFDQSEYGTF